MAKPQFKLVGMNTKQKPIPSTIKGSSTLTDPVDTSYVNAWYRAHSGPTVDTTIDTTPKIDMSAWNPILSLLKGNIQTPAEITASARATALANEQATLAAQKAASDKIIAQYNNQATRAQGFALALGQQQAGQDEDMMRRYTEAANTLGGLGAGLSGATADAYQQSVDANKAAIARLTGGLGEVTSPSGADVTNAANYVGTTIPSTSLASDAASAANLAADAAAAGRFRIGDIARGYTSQANDAIAQAAADARATIGQRPANIQELVNQLTQ